MQAGAQDRVATADIPFSFTVCKEQLPAGKYRIEPFSRANPSIMLFRSEDNRSVEIVCTRDVQGTKLSGKGKLIFNRYGNQYFLSELWFPGERTGSEVLKSEREEMLLRELAPRMKRERVTVKVSEAKPN
jgi:hypothetical protein